MINPNREREQKAFQGLRQILCPIDLAKGESARRQAALAWSLSLASSVPVQFLYVNPFFEVYAGYGPYIDGVTYAESVEGVSPRQLALEDKRRMRQLLESVGVPPGDTRVHMQTKVGAVDSQVSEWIQGTCEKQGAAQVMVVVSKSSSQGWLDFVVGSLATRVVRTSPSPCLVIPENLDTDSWQPRHAIVADDLASNAPQSLACHSFLQALPAWGCESLELVHAFRREALLQAPESKLSHAAKSDDLIYSLIEDNMRHRLESEVEKCGPQWKERQVIMQPGRPEDVLQSRCQKWAEGGLLVLGRSAEASEFGYLGSTLQHLVTAARTPVLILPLHRETDGTQAEGRQHGSPQKRRPEGAQAASEPRDSTVPG